MSAGKNLPISDDARRLAAQAAAVFPDGTAFAEIEDAFIRGDLERLREIAKRGVIAEHEAATKRYELKAWTQALAGVLVEEVDRELAERIARRARALVIGLIPHVAACEDFDLDAELRRISAAATDDLEER